MFSAWFTQPHRPLFSAITESSGVTFTQLTGHLWSLPIEIGGSQGIEKVELLPLAQQTIPFTSDSYVIVDPKRISTALVLYDVSTHARFEIGLGKPPRLSNASDLLPQRINYYPNLWE